jgi:uncharacterized protein (TIRG00374 family)
VPAAPDGTGADAGAPTRRGVEAEQPGPRLWGRHTLLSLVLTLLALGVMLAFVDLDAVWGELKRCNKGLALLGMLSHYATYYVRGARWRRTLRHLHKRAGYWFFTLLVFFYNFVDNVVPAKLGDVYGAHLARINLGVRRSAALGSIVFVRMLDAWLVLVLAAICSSVLFHSELPDSVVWALVFGVVIAAAATAILISATLLKKISIGWLPEIVRKSIDSFRSGMLPRPREFATIAAMTLAIWALESLWMWLLVLAFGVDLGFYQVLFVTMIPILASAFPLTPSGAGVVELSLFGCLRALSVDSTLAVSITVLNRFIDYWLHIALGMAVWALRERLGMRTWREVPLEAEPDPRPAA